MQFSFSCFSSFPALRHRNRIRRPLPSRFIDSNNFKAFPLLDSPRAVAHDPSVAEELMECISEENSETIVNVYSFQSIEKLSHWHTTCLKFRELQPKLLTLFTTSEIRAMLTVLEVSDDQHKQTWLPDLMGMSSALFLVDGSSDVRWTPSFTWDAACMSVRERVRACVHVNVGISARICVYPEFCILWEEGTNRTSCSRPTNQLSNHKTTDVAM